MKVFQNRDCKLSHKLYLIFFLFIVIPVANATNPPEPLRFGILSIAQPSRIFSEWALFVKYIEAKLNQKVEIIIPNGFNKMQDAISQQEVDFFYVNSYVFYKMKQLGKALPLVQMKNISGQVFSHSKFFVRGDSNINSLNELKGKTIGFVSPLGAGGYLAPRAYLHTLGIRAPGEIEMTFTKNLSSSLHQVLLGRIDVGTMCGVNFKLMSLKINTGDLKIIGQSDPYPENVIGVRSDLDSGLIVKLIEVLVNMNNNSNGSKVLSTMRNMKIQEFVPYDEKIEEQIEMLMRQAKLIL